MLFLAFVFAVAMAALIAWIARERGRNGLLWFLYALLIWPIALVHVLVAGRVEPVLAARAIAEGRGRKCPFCAEIIKPEAVVCRYCGRDMPVDPPKPPRRY